MKPVITPTLASVQLEKEVLQTVVREQARVIIDLESVIQYLRSELSAVTERTLLLEKQANKTSENSSKPPSTDGFKKVVQNNREQTDKKVGGQKGHKGHHLAFVEGDAVTKRIYVPVEGVCKCGAELSVSGKALSYRRRQLIELPCLKPVVTEYQLEDKQCTCGKVHQAQCILPYAVQYGSNVQAVASYFQNRQLIPVARTQEILSDVFGLSQVSAGTILAASTIGYERLAEWEAAQIRLLSLSSPMHVDETGVDVNGALHWGHVCSTNRITLYQHHAKRGKLAHEAHGIIPDFQGVLIHDRYSSYNSYPCTHALCNAHLLRDLKGVMSEKQPSGAWASLMYKLINEAHQGVISAEYLEQTYADILATGLTANPQPIRTVGQVGKTAKSDSLKLLECYRDRKADILRFFYDPHVPFDNNLAERDLRMFKLKQKISGCFRTESGAKAFCRNASFIATLKKQGQNVWETLCELYRNKQQWAKPTE